MSQWDAQFVMIKSMRMENAVLFNVVVYFASNTFFRSQYILHLPFYSRSCRGYRSSPPHIKVSQINFAHTRPTTNIDDASESDDYII